MNTGFEFWDYFVFISYAFVILAIGLWVSRSKDGKEKSTEDYFLASKSLPWWAIGASLIAANISAEQFIAMNGSGFAAGLAIASYEWMAAITLLVVGKYFLPIFIEKGLYTIPEFIEKRFSANLKTILAVFWIGLFVFVNLTTVLFLGAKALDIVIGTGDGAPEIFTERKDGVISAYNIRTDRWEVAAEAMDKVSGSIQAKRDAKGKVSKSKEETDSKEKVETKAEVKKTDDGGAKPTEGTAKP